MKKILFAAVLFAATTSGFAKRPSTSASDITNAKASNTKNEKTIKYEVKRDAFSKKKSKTTSKAKSALLAECRSIVVTCTSAYTCQEWSEDQWNTWGSNIQSNYCMYDSPYTP
ncbi:hypothetical protein [Chryseobacterium sp.]|uniref:hypothetical protein n=1 Tax=Chryseobacterium sp. TaxID=1871047 RepID=UPI0035B07337